VKIYNYLFYKAYLSAKSSKNFDDIPTLGGIIFVVACLMFNIFTIALFLEGVGFLEDYLFKEKYKYPFVFLVVLIVLFYYLYKDRFKRIIEKYEEINKGKIQIPAFLVIIFYYFITFGLLLLAGLFRNHNWIVAQ
jgi:hypothetical protein